MRSRAYSSVGVNQVDAAKLSPDRQGQALVVGMDIGKYQILGVAHWPDGTFERPWRIGNPLEIPVVIALLKQLRQGRQLVVALEPSGTYGDALRQALHDAGIVVQRISPKAAHDYAEVFDGVPSQHDGKDAAVVAELAAAGKGKDWPYDPIDPWEQELTYWVERLEWFSRQYATGLGYLEALLGRHWPEATRVLSVSSATLQRVLEKYGGPTGLAADEKAAAQLMRWGGKLLSAEKVQHLLAGARATAGVRQGEWDVQRLREHAERARSARREVLRCKRQLNVLARGHAVLEAQGQAVGVATACVLWASVGDPRAYSCGRAYRKAMGLNLTERSSGIYQGKLKISKRGNPRARQWLYLAALRQVKQAGVQRWYQAKKARDGEKARRALVAVMRKLALALYHVGARGAKFDARRLFGRRRAKKVTEKRAATSHNA
jgi:transposase